MCYDLQVPQPLSRGMETLRIALPFTPTSQERALLLEEIRDLVAAFREDVESGFFAAPVTLEARTRPSRLAQRPHH